MKTATHFRPKPIAAVVLAAALCFLTAQHASADVFYVSNYNTKTILKFTSINTSSLFAHFSYPYFPTGMAVDGAGDLYVDAGREVESSGNPFIEKFTPQGVGSVFANVTAGALAVDPAGNLYASVGNQIEKFTPQGVGSVFATTTIGFGSLTFDSAGNLYAINIPAPTFSIEKFAPDGTATFVVQGVASQAGGIAVNSAGNIFVGRGNSLGIFEFAPDGTSSVFSTQGLPGDLAFDSAGNLYSVEPGGVIDQYAPNGSLTYFTPSGLSYPISMAFQPVPESTSLSLLALPAVFALTRRQLRNMEIHPAPLLT